MDELVGGWVGGWVDGWMDGWMDTVGYVLQEFYEAVPTAEAI
jgi:hypothetical protein